MCALCDNESIVYVERGSPVRIFVLTLPGTTTLVPYNPQTRKEQYVGYLACGTTVHFIEGAWVSRSHLH